METFDKVKEIISSQLGLSADFEFTMKTTFEEIDADSLDLVEVVMAIEDEYGIEISDEAISEMECMGDLVNFINDLK
ncbi:MAG: acyl carrier protein [Clostridia bacterium]|nr:acyl carrier protein [Oscillospiraceae bacterium]MBQ7005244.1 acyl carrier protein [Clostridia bacterium]